MSELDRESRPSEPGRELQQRRRADKRKRQALRAQLKLGVDALRRGGFDEIGETDLHGYLESLSC